jgi:hypothetical protein
MVSCNLPSIQVRYYGSRAIGLASSSFYLQKCIRRRLATNRVATNVQQYMLQLPALAIRVAASVPFDNVEPLKCSNLHIKQFIQLVCGLVQR